MPNRTLKGVSLFPKKERTLEVVLVDVSTSNLISIHVKHRKMQNMELLGSKLDKKFKFSQELVAIYKMAAVDTTNIKDPWA